MVQRIFWMKANGLIIDPNVPGDQGLVQLEDFTRAGYGRVVVLTQSHNELLRDWRYLAIVEMTDEQEKRWKTFTSTRRPPG